MAVVCPEYMMMYLLPMMLGRTFDMQTKKAGIDIYKVEDLNHVEEPTETRRVESYYSMISDSSDKRSFLGIKGDLALKISSGLVDIKGAGEYLQDTSNSNNSVEILIRLKFTTVIKKIAENAKPLDYWEDLDKDLVGTHVVTEVLYGGEVFASVKFIAHKDEYLRNISAAVSAQFQKKGAFDVNATACLENLAQNVSSMAKMDIVYFANVKLKNVPSTIQGLKDLVADFGSQVQEINNGDGVAICVALKPLAECATKDRSKFLFNPNKEVQDAMADFNKKFDNLRIAKTGLKEFVTSLPDTYPKADMDRLIDFSRRLNDVLKVFHETIGNLDLEQGPEQLTEAKNKFENALDCCRLDLNNRYTMRLGQLKNELAPKEDTTSPRGVYVRWGKSSCGQKKGDTLYNGTIASFPERGIGGGTLYQCLPENLKRNLLTDRGVKGRESTLSAVRYVELSIYPKEGANLNGKIAPCSVCQSLLRPNVRTFTAVGKCPGDWREEYSGFLVSTKRSRLRTEFICLDRDAEVSTIESPVGEFQAYILPVQVGNKGLPEVWVQDKSVPCFVCSK